MDRETRSFRKKKKQKGLEYDDRVVKQGYGGQEKDEMGVGGREIKERVGKAAGEVGEGVGGVGGGGGGGGGKGVKRKMKRSCDQKHDHSAGGAAGGATGRAMGGAPGTGVGTGVGVPMLVQAKSAMVRHAGRRRMTATSTST